MNIKGVSKAKVLLELYNNARPLGLGCLQYDSELMTEEEAQKLLESGQTYFDYVKGRVMKIDLSTDELETDLYNRDNGIGRAEEVIENFLIGKLSK